MIEATLDATATDALCEIRDDVARMKTFLMEIKNALVEQNTNNQKVLEEQRAITRERAF